MDSVEGVVGIASGIAAGSIALVGFGVDSYVEVLSGAVVLWRLAKERHGQELSQAAEHRALRIIAGTFFALAAGVEGGHLLLRCSRILSRALRPHSVATSAPLYGVTRQDR